MEDHQMATTGTIAQVIGSTFDAQFPITDLPEIYNAVHVAFEISGEKKTLVGEVAKHLGGGVVRCVALASTDGVRRGDGGARWGRRRWHARRGRLLVSWNRQPPAN